MASDAKKGLIYAVLAAGITSCTPNYNVVFKDLEQGMRSSPTYVNMRTPPVREEIEVAPTGAVEVRPKSTVYSLESNTGVSKLEGIAYFKTFGEGFDAKTCTFVRGDVPKDQTDNYNRTLDLLLDRSVPENQINEPKPYISDKTVEAVVAKECADASYNTRAVPRAETAEKPVVKSSEKATDKPVVKRVEIYKFENDLVENKVENLTAAMIVMANADKNTLTSAIPLVAGKGPSGKFDTYDLNRCIPNALVPTKKSSEYEKYRSRVLDLADGLAGFNLDNGGKIIRQRKDAKDKEVSYLEIRNAEQLICHRVAKKLRKGPYAKKGKR